MVHLREMLEKDISIVRTIRDRAGELPLKIMDRLRDCADNAICFNFGEVDDLLDLRATSMDAMHVSLPYDYVWFEFNVSFNERGEIPILFAAMAENVANNEVLLTVILRKLGEYMYVGCGETKNNLRLIHPLHPAVDNFAYGAARGILRTALCAMQCVNITATECVPPKKLQKARQKRGKQPLFSYWTLDIDIPRFNHNTNDLGGTHRSPRLHLRRGHIRQLASGNYCWVQPHVVGNKKLGVVHKDYSVKYR